MSRTSFYISRDMFDFLEEEEKTREGKNFRDIPIALLK